MHTKRSSLSSICYGIIALALLFSLNDLSVSANITLGRFEATPQADGSILVVWETATEFNTSGFRLYRALEPLALSADWGAPIHTEQAAGDGFTGATYQYRDTNVTPNVRYYYVLEELTAAGPGQRYGPVNAGIGLTPEPTATATATTMPAATATATYTATASPTATATAQPSAGGPQPAPTATRQFTNTPVPPPTATPGPGATWTPAPQPTATPVPAGQVATPTPTGGTSLLPPPAEPPTPSGAVSSPTPPPSTPEPTPTAVISTPGSAPTEVLGTPAATNTPQVFAQAPATGSLLDMATRPAPTPVPQPAATGRNIRLLLLLGGGAIVVAGLLAVVGLLIWRASRSS